MKTICLIASVCASLLCYGQKRLSYHRDAPVTAPMIFAEGVISVGDYESHADFSVGGDTVMFVKSNPDVSKWTICYSLYKNGKWTKPEVAPFSGQYMDADPFFT